MIFKYVSVLLLAISAFAAVDEGTVNPEIDTTIEYDQSTYASTAAFCDAFRTQCTEMVSQLAKDPAVAIDCVHSQPGPVILVTCYGNSDNVEGMYDYTQNILRFVDASTVAGPGESVQQPTSTASQASSTSARTTSTSGIASATSVSAASSMANNTSTVSPASRTTGGQLSSTSVAPVTSTRQSSTLHSSTTSHSSATLSGTNLHLMPATSVTTSQTTREPSATRGTQRSSTSSSLDTVSPHATTSTKTTPRRVRIVSPAEREALRHHRPSAEQRARVQARVQAVIHQWIESGRRRLFDRKSHKHYQTCRRRPVHRRQTHRSPGKRKKAANLTKPKWCS